MLEWMALGTAAVWFVSSLIAWQRVVELPGLPRLLSLADAAADPVPHVTAILAARDEARDIETTLVRLRAQRGVALTIVAVNDRSRDGTAALLDAQRALDARLDVLHIDSLPDGWLGKNHACDRGAALAPPSADWLLFVDADSWLEPDTIARTVAFAQLQRAEHVCVLPMLRDTTLGGRAIAAAGAVGFFAQGAAVNRDAERAYIGVGSCALFSRSAYATIGGHAALRDEVLEDLRLGRAIRRAGLRSRIALGVDAVTVRWITDFVSYFRVTQKNYFAAVDYRWSRALGFSFCVAAGWAAACTAPLWAPGTAGLAAAAGLASLAIPGAIVARRYGFGAWLGILTPLLVPTAPLGLLWSAYCITRDGGVRWRGTAYPLPHRLPR